MTDISKIKELVKKNIPNIPPEVDIDAIINTIMKEMESGKSYNQIVKSVSEKFGCGDALDGFNTEEIQAQIKKQVIQQALMKRAKIRKLKAGNITPQVKEEIRKLEKETFPLLKQIREKKYI